MDSSRSREASDRPPISSRAVLVALGCGAIPWAVEVLGVAPEAPEVPKVDLWNVWDLRIAAAALVLWVVLAHIGRVPNLLARAPLWGALALAALPALVAAALLPAPITNDEVAYLHQADLYARGELTEPFVAVPYAVRQRQIHEDGERQLRYSKYPPGTALALAPGALLGLPALMSALAGALSAYLTYRIARKLGLSDPPLAAWLLAASPFFLLTQTSFQSEVFTLPAALAGYLALLELREEGARAARWGLAVGACAGWIFLTRPLTGVVYAAALAPGVLFGARGPRWAGLRGAVGAVLGGLPFLAATLYYNQSLTGDPLLAPYAAYASVFSPWDVYPFFRATDYIQNPVTVFFQSLTRQWDRWVPALFGVFGAFALGFWGLWRGRRRDGGAGLALAVLIPLAYGFHWYPGHWAYLGPLYSYEVLGILTVAALALLEEAPAGWRRSLPVVALAAGAALCLVRVGDIRAESAKRAAPQLAAEAQSAPGDAVVLIPHLTPDVRLEKCLKFYSPSAPPFGPGRTYLREFPKPGQTRAVLEQLGLAGRPVFRFVPDKDWQSGRLVPYQP